MTNFRVPLISRSDMKDIFVCSSSSAFNSGNTGYIFNVKTKSIEYLLNPSGNTTPLSNSYYEHIPRTSPGSYAFNKGLLRGKINPFGEFIFKDSQQYFTAVQFTTPMSISYKSNKIELKTRSDYVRQGKTIKGEDIVPLTIDPGINTTKASSIRLEAESVDIVGNMVPTGLILPVVNLTNMNTHDNKVPGSMVLNTNNNKVYVWTGSSWVALN